MGDTIFTQHMRAFDRWKAELIQTVQGYQRWLGTHRKTTPEVDIRLFDTIESLKSDRLTIAFVAEFSRGKTELINAIFFSDYKRRLLPSEAGRTTMCPTELFYDKEESQAYIRLLPIETRKQDISISELKKDISQWQTINLDVDSPEQMVEALKAVVKTKTVDIKTAHELGLGDPDGLRRRRGDSEQATEVDIPVWRLALISFPHPLLQQGLSILDTPGLNALGTEPELTLNMLPNAHAVLFVLAADTGVTRSDLDMWEQHIHELSKNNQGIAAAINKIDTLWDELKETEEINASITSQQNDVSKALALDIQHVFPVSAQKALVAKTKDDNELLAKSRLPELEFYLAETIIPAKQNIVRYKVITEIGDLIQGNREELQTELKETINQLKELASLSGKNSHLVLHMMQKAKDKQTSYNQDMERFQSSRRTLNQHATLLLDELSLEKFDRLISNTRTKMSGSWSTGGLKDGMKTLFDGIRETMKIAARHADDTHAQVIEIYQLFDKENELKQVKPKPFSTQRYTEEMEKLYLQAEEFRSSPMTTMTEQGFVIKKFFISLVSHGRNLFFQANQEAENWFKGILAPLARHITAHKRMLEQHMETLSKINESKDSFANRKTELENKCIELKQQINTLDSMLENISAPIQEQGKTEPSSHAASA